MTKKDRQKVFDKYGGRCAYCGCELDSSWQVDHAVSKCYWFYIDTQDPKKVNDLSNLMPACRMCNHYKRSHCINDYKSHTGFRTYMLNFHKRLAKLPKTTVVRKTMDRIEYMNKVANLYNITVDNPFTGIFYFEKQQPQTHEH